MRGCGPRPGGAAGREPVSAQARPGGAGTAATAGTPPLVLPLHELGRRDLAVAGGKGANLGELVRAGFPVPPGFVVTTAAYDRFVADNRLGETIARVLREERGSGAAIRDAFEGAPIPPEVGRDIQAAYHRLGQGAVAVRSSATAEDLPQAAFAGQQDTFLNVVGTEALLDAVRRCWASLWSDRAIAYRAGQGLDQQAVKLAVVVQRLVAAEVAGVLFTANPVTGAPDETIVDASPGLGEAVVSGLMAEMLPVRPYPLEVTTWGPELVISALLGPMLRMLGLALRVDRLFVEEDGVIVRLTGQLPIRPTPSVLLAPLPILRQARRYDPVHWRADPLLPESQARARALEALD